MNSRALDLAVSTLILIVLGILVLIGLIYFVTDGFKKFTSTTKPFTDTAQTSAVKQACSLACSNQDKLTFCCRNYTIQNENVKCTDSRLEINCNLDCVSFSCN